MKRICILILFLGFLLAGCTVNKKDDMEVRYFLLDTVFGDLNPQVTTIAKKDLYEKNPTIEDDLNAIVQRLDQYYSTSINTSKVYELNENSGKEPIEVSEELIMVLKEAKRVSELSIVENKALYDITIAPIVDLWDINNLRFSKTQMPEEIPTNEDILDLLDLVDYNNIIIDEEAKTVLLKNEGMKIDLGSILKGYAANLIRDYLKEVGIEIAIINVAGNIITMGYNQTVGKDEKWQIKIQTPDVRYGDESYFGYVSVNEITAVTSGSYERFILGFDGKEYHHILDPRDGYPSDSDILSVTILTQDSMTADAMSTAIFALGLERGYEVVESLDSFDAIFVTKDKEIYVTSGIKNNFVYNSKVNAIGYVYKGVKNGTNN